MYIAIVNKHLVGNTMELKPKDMFLVTAETREKFDRYIKVREALTYIPFYDVFEPFASEAKTVLLIRSGSLSDIIALSALFEHLKGKNILLYTNRNNEPYLEWFTNRKVRLIDFQEPLFSGDLTDIVIKSGIVKRVDLPGSIETEPGKNWYKTIFESTDAVPSSLRPSLRTHRGTQVPSSVHNQKAIMFLPGNGHSKITLNDFYTAVKESNMHDYTVYVYQSELSESEQEFAEEHKGVKMILYKTGKENLLNAYDAELVVGDNVHELHFREGIERPAIAINPVRSMEGYKYVQPLRMNGSDIINQLKDAINNC